MPYELLEEEVPEENIALKLGKEGLRQGARTASNIATRAVGLPGDIFSLINQFIAKPATKAITGQEGVPYEETFLGKALPTTGAHREALASKTGEYLKPRNKIESFVDDVLEDTALLLSPSSVASKGIKAGGVLKSFFKSVGANLAGETTKQIAGSETAGDITKLGSLLVLSVLDQESAAKQVSKLYKKAENNLPASDMANAKPLEKNLNNLKNDITKYRPEKNLSTAEKYVVTQADKVMDLIHSGEINVQQAWAQKRSLNEELSSLYKEVPTYKDQKKVRALAKQITSLLNSTIKEYGGKNPAFYKPFKEADKAFGALARSNFVSHWIENNVVQSPLTHGLLHVVGGNIGSVASGTVGAILPYQAAKLTYRIAKSPTLAKIYGNTLKSAAKEDVKAFNKYLKELDDAMQKEESEDKFEFID
jgi:hypothetical protein